MPLTRSKQQATLQAHSHDQSAASNHVLSSTSLNSQIQTGNDQQGVNRNNENLRSLHQDPSCRNQVLDHEMTSSDINNNKIRLGTSHEQQQQAADLSHFGSLASLDLNTASRLTNSHSVISGALDQNGLLRDSTDWTSFGNTSMTQNSNNNNSGANTLHHHHDSPPFYSMSEGDQESNSAQETSFIDSLGMHHREDLFTWKESENIRPGNGGSHVDSSNSSGNVNLSASFTTPASTTTTLNKTLNHSRSYNNNEALAMAQKRLQSVQSSNILSMDLQRLGPDSMNLHLSLPNSVEQENIQNYQHQHSQSIEMTNSHDGLLRLSATTTPIDASCRDRFDSRERRILSQSSSLRSTSPSDQSVSSTAFLGTLSPHTSISMRHGGDSSVDTSLDSISNSVTSMSANPSRCSSTSDEFLPKGTLISSKRSNKGKTRLRNIDRKAICEAARDDPKVRQEDLAVRFGIERSTVSKTLKHKEKWLAIQEESEGANIIKHRTGKYPELEANLAEWARDQLRQGHLILDVSIRNRALELAKEADIGVDAFKASVGWIEKFRDRHEMPKSLQIASDSANSYKGGDGAKRGNHKGSIKDVEMNLSSINNSTEISMMSSEEVDMAGLFSPRNTILRSHTSSSSMSNEESSSMTTHETPKASKRHYDDMNANQKASSSISSGMASMHFIQRPSEGGLLTLEEDPEMDTSIHEAELVEMSNSSKRRKGGVSESSQHTFSTPQSWSSVRGPIRRTHSDSQEESHLSNNLPHHQRQQSQITAAAVAAAQEIRRQEGEKASLPGDLLTQVSPTSPRDFAYTRMNRTSSSPLERSTFYRNYGPGTSRTALHSPTTRSMNEEQQQAMPTSSSSTSFSLGSVGFNEDRRVTLEEARESLDLVLAFIARQPANLSPSDYFVLGNLQGTLTALAGQNQQSSHQQQQQQHHQHHPQSRQSHQSQQLQSPLQLNMLGATSDVSQSEQSHR